MIRSLAVVLLPLLVITFIATRNLHDHPVTVVDWRPVLAAARQQAPYPVLAPTHLPPEWRATRVTWVKAGDPFLNGEPAVRNTWQLGFLDPDNVFIDLNQGDKRSAEFIAEQTVKGRPDGESVVSGQKWERRVTDDGQTRSLVISTPQVTTIVVGDTSYQALESYAATLSTS